MLSLEIARATSAPPPTTGETTSANASNAATSPNAAPANAATSVNSGNAPTSSTTANTATPTNTSSRIFHAHDCSELVEAAAVAIALALGGTDGAAAPSTAIAALEPEPPASKRPPSADDGSKDDTSGALTTRLRKLGVVARAEALLDTASLGGLALGAGAELGVRWGAIGVRAHGVGLPSRQIRLAPSQFVELSLWAAGLRGCYRVSDNELLLDVCGGGEVGAFGAAGKGLVDASSRRDVWGATTWGAWLGFDVTEHLQAGARLEAVLPLSRERYLVNRNEVVHEVSGASLRLGLSLGGTLGSH
ncbi:MAG TPA: hypothetical protein VMG12_18900 [Polyangiaceae bacterium]|nr:hypothetical protein [Polyangiaceae bacterium]